MSPQVTPEIIESLTKAARRRCFGTLEPDDVVASALLRITTKIHLFQGGNFAAWCMTVMMNVLRNEITRRMNHPEPSLLSDAEVGGWALNIQDSCDPEAELIDRGYSEDTKRVIDALPQTQREVLLLHAEGFSHGEIQHVLGLRDRRASYTMLHRARRRAADLYAVTA